MAIAFVSLAAIAAAVFGRARGRDVDPVALYEVRPAKWPLVVVGFVLLAATCAAVIAAVIAVLGWARAKGITADQVRFATELNLLLLPSITGMAAVIAARTRTSNVRGWKGVVCLMALATFAPLVNVLIGWSAGWLSGTQPLTPIASAVVGLVVGMVELEERFRRRPTSKAVGARA